MKGVKKFMEAGVSIAAMWGALLSTYIYFAKLAGTEPILTTAIEIQAQRVPQDPKEVRFKLFVTNTGTETIQLAPHASIILIKNSETNGRFTLDMSSDGGDKPAEAQLPLLLSPGNKAEFISAYYPITKVINPLNGYAVVLPSRRSYYVSYTARPKNIRGIMRLLKGNAQKYFGSFKTYAVRAYRQ